VGDLVPDVVDRSVRLLFVGYNPGPTSGRTGHHFAGPGNLFWRLLHEAGLTSVLLSAEQDRDLLRVGIGITNLVARVTPSSADLRADEMAAGGARLRRLLEEIQPEVVAFLGKEIYRYYAGLPTSRPIPWGRQSASGERPELFVLPNPSRRSTLPYAERLRWYTELAHRLQPVAEHEEGRQ
jgi:TDG/mug DNA glycosylase family protein